MCKEAGFLLFILADEATRTMKLELDMLISSLESVVDNYTRLGLAGDTCQVKTVLQTLICTSSLHISCSLGVSAVAWILDRLIAEKPTQLQLVKQVDPPNRDTPAMQTIIMRGCESSYADTQKLTS